MSSEEEDKKPAARQDLEEGARDAYIPVAEARAYDDSVDTSECSPAKKPATTSYSGSKKEPPAMFPDDEAPDAPSVSFATSQDNPAPPDEEDAKPAPRPDVEEGIAPLVTNEDAAFAVGVLAEDNKDLPTLSPAGEPPNAPPITRVQAEDNKDVPALSPAREPPDAPLARRVQAHQQPRQGPDEPQQDDIDQRQPPPQTSSEQAPQQTDRTSESEPSCFRNLMTAHWACTVISIVLNVVVLILLVESRGGDSTSPPTASTPEDETSPETPPQISPMTRDNIIERDFVRCGVRDDLDGFGKINPTTGELEGFEIDLCRAIAAGVLGSGDKVELVVLSATERFIALQNDEVDVLTTHDTYTMDRDVFESSAQAGFSFSVPYFYDGLTFGGQPKYVDCIDNLNGNCTGLRICVLAGTTYVDIVKDRFKEATINSPDSNIKSYESFVQSRNNPSSGCNVIAGGPFEVAESVVRKNTPSFQQDYEYKLSSKTFSHEPLALVTREDDPFWSDMVQWVLQALLADEEREIEGTAAALIPSTPYFGPQFTSFFQNVINAVGNYRDLYERHLSAILPRTEMNKINDGKSTGLIFSFPFGSPSTQGPGPIDGGTLKETRERGHLRCGITRLPGFAEFDYSTGEWKGFDVDFCKAISAAIFNGVSSTVVYTVIPATERFKALANGDVDVLSRITTWNLERDVAETTSGGQGFDFSQINFYDGLAVGGEPQYARCADREDWISTQCTGLKVCVNTGTTTIEIARKVFRGDGVLVEKEGGEAVIQGLIKGDCNVIIGAVLEIVEDSLIAQGYVGEYEMGVNRLSKDPLALVTRQDDPQFSAFVKWIVSATFYAEEEGIDQNSAELMPLISLFGPGYGRMLIDAIGAVGNYGEIYERHLQNAIPRSGPNQLSVNPYGPRHYPLPGP